MSKPDSMLLLFLFSIFMITLGAGIVFFVPLYVHRSLSKINKMFQICEVSVREQSAIIADNKTQLGKATKSAKDIKKILLKYKDEKFDTRIMETINDEIDIALTDESCENTINIDEHDESDNDNFGYKTIETLNSDHEKEKNNKKKYGAGEVFRLEDIRKGLL